MLDLAFGGGVALGVPARGDGLQAEVALDAAHERFLAPPVLAVAGDAAVEADAAGEDVDVLVLGVGVAGDEVLVLIEAHAVEVALADLAPLLIRQSFTKGGGQRDVQDGFAEVRPQPTDLAELGGEIAGTNASHVAIENAAVLFAQVVVQGTAEALAFDGFGDHSGSTPD